MQVTVNIPSLPKGAEVSVQGLGDLKNGHTYDFDSDAVDLYKILNNLEKAPKELHIGEAPKKQASHPVGDETKATADGDKQKDGK